MDQAARDLMEEYPDIVLGFGESDEFRSVAILEDLLLPMFRWPYPLPKSNICSSFLLRKSTDLFNRRQSKIVSSLTSLFTSSYVFHWSSYFPNDPLQYPPSFDGRIVLYPGEKQVRDYFAWRQADSPCSLLVLFSDPRLTQRPKRTLTICIIQYSGRLSNKGVKLLPKLMPRFEYAT